MKKELGIFASQFARERVKTHVAKRLPLDHIDIYRTPPQEFPKKLIVVGGDGSGTGCH